VLDDPGVLHQHRLLWLVDFFTRLQIKLSHALIFNFHIFPDIVHVPLQLRTSSYPRLLIQLRACRRDDTQRVDKMRSARTFFLSRSPIALVFS
jgi:hypothetical protein